MAVQQLPSEPDNRLTVVEPQEEQERGITLRSILIGFILIIPAVFWGVYGDVVSQTDLTSSSVMMPPILMLTALLLLNWPLKRFTPRFALTQAELLTIYIMLTVSVIISGMGGIQFLVTTVGAVYYFKTPENNWAGYMDYAPTQLMPKLSAIEGFYKGSQPVPWSAWTTPIILWSCFIFAMLFCMACVNTIIRKQWVERERLSFPIIVLPLEMTDQKSRFFSNKLMWIGFFVAAGVQSLNSVAFLFPNFPSVQIRAYDLGPSFPVAPWNAVGYFPTTFYPLAIGLGFIVSADISFSCWFFYLFTKLQLVLASATGLSATTGGVSRPPYLAQQGTGAFFGIAISALWLARRHLKDVAMKAFKNDPEVDDSKEPLSYRTAVIGALIGFGVMIGICIAAGMAPWIAIAFMGVYILFSFTIARLRATAGPPWVMGPDVVAMDTLVHPLGSGVLGKSNMIVMAYFAWFNFELRCNPMPHTLEGMKLAQTARIRQRSLFLVMLFAIAVGIGAGFWACLSVWYEFGAATAKVEGWRTAMGRVPFDKVTNYINNPTKPDFAGTMATFYGGAVTIGLGYLRNKFVSFPFHPVGYVLAHTQTLVWLWCPFFVAWCCKVLITKYLGIKGYRAALPFFLGLVLGDFMASSCWALAGSILGIQMYRCFPC